jgi:hypothetical protein
MDPVIGCLRDLLSKPASQWPSQPAEDTRQSADLAAAGK